MLFATSCQNDQGFDTTVGETSTVTFAVETPEIATRAYSDGLTATHLQYAVYDANGIELTDLTVTDATINGSTTVNLQLTTGNTYSVIFWAAAPNAPYTVDFAAKTMTVDYTTAVSNDEARDAFYKYHTFTVIGAQTETIELRRPFAQLNIGTADYAASKSAGYVPTQSAVVVKNVYNTLNLATGVVENEVEANFALANIKKDETFPVAGYEYMAMNYLLVATDKAVVDVEFTYTDANNDAKARTVGSVPVQRNYRTNIYGNLLTSNVDINVEIKPEYDDDNNVEVPYATIDGVAYKSFADAMAAVETGKTIKLEGETTLEGVANSKLFTVNKNITIDLNGYGFVAKMPDVTANSSIFEVVNGGELTIIGDGNVKFVTKAAPNHLVAFINNIGGTVNLKGGNWTISETGDYALIPTFVDNNSNTSNVTLNIDGGTYTFHRALFRNFVNNNTTVATMNISGGTFNGRESKAGVIWNQKPNANIQKGAGVINVTGGTFNNVEIKDDFAESVTVTVPDNNTEDVVLNTGTVGVTVPADVASAGDDYKVVVRNESIKTDNTTNKTTVSFDLTMYKNDATVSGGDVIYTITKNVGQDLFISEVTHNGTALTNANTGADQTYTYDSNTGVLTIYTKSFSPFAVTYIESKDYVRKLNKAHNKNSTISVSTGADFLPIVAVNPEIYGYSVYDGDTRIANAVTFRFSKVKKETISENSYKVSFNLAVLDENGNELEIKDGRMNPYIASDPREHLKVYMNLIEVPADYAISQVKVGNTVLTPTQNTSGNCATGEYWIGSNPKDLYFQSRTAGLIEVTLTK